MSKPITQKGSDVKIYLGGTLYPATSISWSINYGEQPIYGVDSAFPQEIASSQVLVSGTISGLSVKNTGDLQGYGLRSKINELLHSAYLSLKIQDRSNDSILLWVPQIKVTSESYSIGAKQVVRINFQFVGLVPYNMLDLKG